MTTLGALICLAALAVALYAGLSDDGALRIFDGSAAFALAIVGGSLIVG